MSVRGSVTTASPIKWCDVDKLIKCCMINKKYDLASLVVAGCFYGLKHQDIIELTWNDVFSDTFLVHIKHSKTNLQIKNNQTAIAYFNEIYKCYGYPQKTNKICINKYGNISTLQRVNKALKEIRPLAKLQYCENFTTESLRKTFGRHVYCLIPEAHKVAGLTLLAETLGQENASRTLKYLDITMPEQEEFGFISLYEFMVNSENETKINCSLNKDEFYTEYIKPSFVYLMKDSNIPGVIKIGKTNNLKQREGTLQCEKPTIELYKYIQLDGERSAFDLERKLHSIYKNNRVRGEWFRMEENDLNELLKLYEWCNAENLIE